ncbi:hypothetical protein BDP27DRAFT_1415329 [Rhodocollybia butyracea]|uniref:Uncharacterized protein n=1 Tax=Rhodocollybia butyracea TaxID=206335 RepID=A0A9P5Q6S4_9AGAR|nr:hypothetical protein BDP27DRAFT_1415329 [Rhodocollybia butyracea]
MTFSLCLLKKKYLKTPLEKSNLDSRAFLLNFHQASPLSPPIDMIGLCPCDTALIECEMMFSDFQISPVCMSPEAEELNCKVVEAKFNSNASAQHERGKHSKDSASSSRLKGLDVDALIVRLHATQKCEETTTLKDLGTMLKEFLERDSPASFEAVLNFLLLLAH